MKVKALVHILMLLVIIGFVTACASDSNNANGNAEINHENNAENFLDMEENENGANDNADGNHGVGDPEPITLLFNNLGGAPDDLLEDILIGPTEEKFPHITFEIIREDPEELLLAGEIPDMFFTNTAQFIPEIIDNDLMLDLSPFIEAHNYDVGRFSDAIIESIYNYSDGGELYALPLTANREALFYNKDLFDQFGVQYPSESVTWEDIYQLVTQLAREEDGVEYRGIDFPWDRLINQNQLSLSILDAETHEGIQDFSDWASLFDLLTGLYDIPGNELPEERPDVRDAFLEGTLAMYVWTNPPIPGEIDYDYNMVPLPDIPEAPGVTNQAYFTHYSISPVSEHKEEAFEVLMHALSDDVLTLAAREGRQLAVETIDYTAEYGQDSDYPSDLNVGAFFEKDFALSPPFSRYEYDVRGILYGAFEEVTEGNRDINEVLREAEEEVNIRVQDLKAQE